MTFYHGTENIIDKLKQNEIDELVEYCEDQGFTKEQTELFVKNSLARLFNDSND